MKQTLFFSLLLLLVFPGAVLAGTTQCSKYHVRLEGTNTAFPVAGHSYTEILEMHKVGQSSGYDGKWQIDRFTQINTYPHVIRPPVTWFDIVEFGDGQWAFCAAHTSGNVITNVCFGGEWYLDVLNNRVGSKKYGNWVGAIAGKQMKIKFDANNPLEPVITGEIRQPEKKKLTLNIVAPTEDKFEFNGNNPGYLEIEFKARVTPSEYERDVQWYIPKIAGSEYVVEPSDARGPHIKVTYKGLPADNSQFGPKSVQAMVNVGGCTTQETKQVKVFYLRDAKNNPEGQDPNWLYYWKQTPAAKPRGQTVNIEYGGTTFGACSHPKCAAQYTPNYAHCTIHVCDLKTKLGSNFKNRFPLLSIASPYHNGWATSKHIDTFATLVIHEFTHWQAYHNWKHGKTETQLHAEDSDKDGVPTSAEPSYDFDPDMFQTHFANHPDLKHIGGDEEWLAYSSMSEIELGSLDKYDWGKPGKNWP
jgi:hypothetical protein